MKQKILALLLIICMIATMTPTALAEETKPRLSEMTDAEILAFLEENEIEIPVVNYATGEEMFDFVRKVIDGVEENPAYFMDPSAYESLLLYQEIKTAVNSYYGVDPSQIPISTANCGMQYSTAIVLPWQSIFEEYNCYAYTLGLTDDYYTPGNFCGKSFSNTYAMAEAVKGDLQHSSYKNHCPCVKITSTRPTYEDAIAVRRTGADFHVMRLFSDGVYWKHKPGTSTILQYDSMPSTSVAWISEGYGKNGFQIFDSPISGSIYYVVFRKTHTASTSSTATGNNYHSGSYHYYEYDCTCSFCYDDYTTWSKVSCSGNCSTINSEISEEITE